MINKAPAYQWYPKDILGSVRVAEMPADVECWYRRALDYCWINGNLPADPIRCAAIIGKGCTVTGAEWVLEMFTTDRKNPSRKIHDRQEFERKKQAANRREKSKAGKASAAKRKQEKELAAQNNLNSRSTGVATGVPTKGATEFNSSSSSSSSDLRGLNTESLKDLSLVGSAAEIAAESAPEKSTQKRKVGTRIPEPFNLTPEMRQWAAKERPDIDPVYETKRFVNHWRSKTGKDATKLKWNLTWQNWILGARAINGVNTNGNGQFKPKPSAADRILNRPYHHDPNPQGENGRDG